MAVAIGQNAANLSQVLDSMRFHLVSPSPVPPFSPSFLYGVHPLLPNPRSGQVAGWLYWTVVCSAAGQVAGWLYWTVVCSAAAPLSFAACSLKN
jgi:hypothetical protein